MKLLKKSIIINMLLFAGISQGMISQEELLPVDKLSAIANKKFDASMIIYSKHAKEQMTDRKISEEHVESAISTGRRFRDIKNPQSIVIKKVCRANDLDKPRPLVIVAKPITKEEKLLVITTYWNESEVIMKPAQCKEKSRKQKRRNEKQIEESNKKGKGFEKSRKGDSCEYLRMDH